VACHFTSRRREAIGADRAAEAGSDFAGLPAGSPAPLQGQDGTGASLFRQRRRSFQADWQIVARFDHKRNTLVYRFIRDKLIDGSPQN